MSSIKQFLRSETPKEAIGNLPYNFFNWCSFVFITGFFLFILKESFYGMTMIDISLISWSRYNRYVLIFGLIIIALYACKIIFDKKYSDFKTFAKNNITVLLFAVFALLMIISTFVNGIDRLSVFGSSYRKEGLLGYLSYIIYFLLAYINNSSKLKKALLYIFTTISALTSLIALIDINVPSLNITIEQPGAFLYIFFQHNHYGYFLLISLITMAMLIVTETKLFLKLIFCAEFIITGIILLYNNTLGAYLAAIAALIFICIVYSISKSKFTTITLIPIILFSLVNVAAYNISEQIKVNLQGNFIQVSYDKNLLLTDSTHDSNIVKTTGYARIVLWERTTEHIAERPLFGFAADGDGERLLSETHDNDRAHCEFLSYAVFFGIPAAIVYFAAVFTPFLHGLYNRKKLTDLNLIGLCTAFAYLVSSVIGNSMYYTAPLLFIFLGIGLYNNDR